MSPQDLGQKGGLGMRAEGGKLKRVYYCFVPGRQKGKPGGSSTEIASKERVKKRGGEELKGMVISGPRGGMGLEKKTKFSQHPAELLLRERKKGAGPKSPSLVLWGVRRGRLREGASSGGMTEGEKTLKNGRSRDSDPAYGGQHEPWLTTTPAKDQYRNKNQVPMTVRRRNKKVKASGESS